MRVLTVSGDDLTNTDDLFKVAMHQIADAFAQLEKARLVGKLKAARERKRATGAKVEGRRPHTELLPDVVSLAKRLHRASPKTGKRRSLREIAAELARAGYINERGKPYAALSIKMMLGDQTGCKRDRGRIDIQTFRGGLDKRIHLGQPCLRNRPVS